MAQSAAAGNETANATMIKGVLSFMQQRAEGKAQRRAGALENFFRNREAKNVIAASIRNSLNIKKIGGKILGQQKALRAASGVQLSGSALDVLGQSIEEIESESLEELFRGQEEAFGIKASGALASRAGKNARTASNTGAVSTLVGSYFKSKAQRLGSE